MILINSSSSAAIIRTGSLSLGRLVCAWSTAVAGSFGGRRLDACIAHGSISGRVRCHLRSWIRRSPGRLWLGHWQCARRCCRRASCCGPCRSRRCTLPLTSLLIPQRCICYSSVAYFNSVSAIRSIGQEGLHPLAANFVMALASSPVQLKSYACAASRGVPMNVKILDK